MEFSGTTSGGRVMEFVNEPYDPRGLILRDLSPMRVYKAYIKFYGRDGARANMNATCEDLRRRLDALEFVEKVLFGAEQAAERDS